MDLICDRCGTDEDVWVRDDCGLCEPTVACSSCATHLWVECAERGHRGAA